jgi:hypothetical protein
MVNGEDVNRASEIQLRLIPLLIAFLATAVEAIGASYLDPSAEESWHARMF